MAFDWHTALDFRRAAANLRAESYGDWHDDPWGWPEIDFLVSRGHDAIRDFCAGNGVNEVALLDIPKESWGTRPAVVLTPIDRLVYQALVDSLSLDIAGELSPNAFGWRLPVRNPSKGQYSHNGSQWDWYRGHLETQAAAFPVALKTDIVSCFASMSIDVVQAELDERTPSNHISKRLLGLLGGFGETRHRSGLPQRSSASALIANMIMRRLDDVLEYHASALPVVRPGGVQYHSFARWMDDMWLFVDDAGKARKAQIELQRQAETMGLYLNASKTDVLEGGAAAQEIAEIEHSAVDAALNKVPQPDSAPLQELIERVVDGPEKMGKTSIRFAVSRMLEHGNRYKVHELALAAKRMPHAADSLAPLFANVFTQGSLQDWFMEYVQSDWSGFEWTTAHYMRIFGRDHIPSDRMITYMVQLVENPATSLPLLAVASQRLAEWKAAIARTVFRSAVRTTSNSHAIRVLSLAALNAGESRQSVRGWLDQHDSNRAIIELLESRHFKKLDVVGSFWM